MDIPHRSLRPSGTLPEIYVNDSNSSQTDRYRMASRSASHNSTSSPISSSIAMPIPNSREPVPPPLPPPRHIPDIANGGNNGPDLAWRWANAQEDAGSWGGSVSSVQLGSSLYGNFTSRRSSAREERPEHMRRGSSNATIKSADARDQSYTRTDEGYASFRGTSNGSNRSVPALSIHWHGGLGHGVLVRSIILLYFTCATMLCWL